MAGPATSAQTVLAVPAASDRGETLIEVLIAVAIMSVAVVAVVGGLVTSVLVTDIHRKQAVAGGAVRDYAEAVENAVAAGGYVPCASAASYASPAGFAAPAGYIRSVVAGSLGYFSGGAWQSGCTADTGLQRLTLQVASDDGRASERLLVVLRRPCRVSDAPCA